MRIISLFILIAYSSLLNAQLSVMQQKAIVLKRIVEMKHYAPRAVDDSFSVAVFKTVLNNLDARRLLLTQVEYQQLLALSTTIDDELKGGEWRFLNKFSDLYKKSLQRADSIINKYLQKPLDFTVDEKIISVKRNSGNFNFAADVAALSSRWGRFLKYSLLDVVYELATADSSKKTVFKTALPAQEAGIREKIKQKELKGIKRILDHPGGFAELTANIYLDAIATCFDPHTNYFSQQGKEEFQAALSTEAYFFGVVFTENDNGQVAIEKLTPGGPAWKSGEIHKGDELVSLVWEGKEAQDVSSAGLEEVYRILDQSIHDKLMFRFKKADGTMNMVLLRKEKMQAEENIVKSFVLKGEKKLGYILLPGFYTEWENESGSSCANDVAKEIIKLKKENIDGLILDVRYNGGGSIGEAMDMIGIFIEEGPVAAEKENNGKLVTLKDPNRGTIYDGPLVLMVNGQSASASEMLAAALQDYNRAVIAGSNTFGKATMQSMFAVDTSNGGKAAVSEKSDMAKITIGKLYRVTGGTAQLRGVQPDIVLPDAFDGLAIGERFELFALSSDSVKRNTYYKPLPYLPIAGLSQRSAARLNASPGFQIIKNIVAEQQQLLKTETRTIPLKAELFEKWAAQQAANSKAITGEIKPSADYTVENNAFDKKSMAGDAYADELNKIWLTHMATDIHLQEVFHILTDLINLQKQ
jgi:carboxyl-terminal processing protease